MATIQEVYIALFGRPADRAGFDYYVAATGNGADLSAVGALSNSPEYVSRFEGMGDAEMVNQIFIDLFGRAADPAGLLFYVELLRSGAANLQDIAIRIIDGATGVDQDVVDNKVVAAQLFTDALDTPAEVAAYAGSDAAAQGRAFLSTVTADDATIPTELQVNAFIASIGAGENFDITVAINTLAAAQQAEADFLASLDLDNNPATATARADIASNVTAAEGALARDLADGSDNVLAAELAGAKAAQSAVEADIAAVDGLAEAIVAYEAAVAAEAEAAAAAALAATTQTGEEGRFGALNTGALVVATDGTATYDATALIISTNGTLELAAGVTEATNPGVTALLSAVSAAQAAAKAEANAEALVASTQAEAVALDADTDSDGVSDLYEQLVAARAEVVAAQSEVDQRAELRADLAEAQDLADQLDAIDAAIADAQATFGPTGLNFDLEVVDSAVEAATAGNDLFLANNLDANDVITIAGFGADGDDLIYFGQGFKFVELNDEVVGRDGVGGLGVLEIFLQQQGADTVLYIEEQTFNGSDLDGSFNGATITLTGVSAEDVSFNNGYLTIA
ncbi:DUF4214 domain-containing protein [Devosia sp. 919]|uniref:DUF4214 domain-containing protein n=1 Tax=Devosia sp. 919 TaxID=2726065 RepID=UPI0015550495|nr:DUF4214 domain-containing protein [Devosia sp. 919]